MEDREKVDRDDKSRDTARDRKRGDEKTGREWADEAAKARTADDPRARTPSDAVGQPSTRSFDE